MIPSPVFVQLPLKMPSVTALAWGSTAADKAKDKDVACREMLNPLQCHKSATPVCHTCQSPFISATHFYHVDLRGSTQSRPHIDGRNNVRPHVHQPHNLGSSSCSLFQNLFVLSRDFMALETGWLSPNDTNDLADNGGSEMESCITLPRTPSFTNDCGWLRIRLAVKTMGGIRQTGQVNDFMVFFICSALPRAFRYPAVIQCIARCVCTSSVLRFLTREDGNRNVFALSGLT
jgi:hypothetical protein